MGLFNDRRDVLEGGGGGLAVPFDAGFFGAQPLNFEAARGQFVLELGSFGAVGGVENLAADALDFGDFLTVNGETAGHDVEAVALLLMDLEGARGQLSAGDQYPLAVTVGRLVGAMEAVAVAVGGVAVKRWFGASASFACASRGFKGLRSLVGMVFIFVLSVYPRGVTEIGVAVTDCDFRSSSSCGWTEKRVSGDMRSMKRTPRR